MLAVPKESILEQGSTSTLFVATDGKAKEQQVALGPSIDDQVIIASGLAAGQQIIVKGHHGLKDGDSIKSVVNPSHDPRPDGGNASRRRQNPLTQ